MAIGAPFLFKPCTFMSYYGVRTWPEGTLLMRCWVVGSYLSVVEAVARWFALGHFFRKPLWLSKTRTALTIVAWWGLSCRWTFSLYFHALFTWGFLSRNTHFSSSGESFCSPVAFSIFTSVVAARRMTLPSFPSSNTLHPAKEKWVMNMNHSAQLHTVGFYGKCEQFRSPTGTSQFWSFSVKFWFYLT